ncbi:hypothetical protein CRG98_023210 [Punica granatum]|uniref:Tf2-1-like SH3-like domain-containing protein n=1 Tax=Punica granatum TaxID=22663 RepID=A0A2I0JJH4_PUNGR|nr:hypothetical protein CRG98_023210 [Punica granatum]
MTTRLDTSYPVSVHCIAVPALVQAPSSLYCRALTHRSWSELLGNKKRHSVEFEMRDFVWAILIKNRYPAGEYNKLSTRKIGPVKVIEKINSNSYRLKISNHIRTTEAFNVKHPIPYTGDSSNEDDSMANSLHLGENDAEEEAASWYLKKNRL